MSSVAIVANPYHRTEIQADHAVRMTDVLYDTPDARTLETRAIADDAYIPVAVAYAAQVGYATALDDLLHDLQSVGLPLAGYIVDFAQTRGIELEVGK